MVQFDETSNDMSDDEVQVYQYGLQCRATYRQHPRSSDVISIAYSPFSGDFALLDGAGITHWNKDTQVDKRLLTYPSNKKHLLKQIIFIPKYGIYFALAKDNTLQLLNSLLHCTFVFDADNGTILCMLYDIRHDILITAGVGGLKMWRYLHHKCERDQAGTEQYFVLYRQHPVKPSQWITRIELNESNNRLLCVAQKEVIVLTCNGDYLFTISTAPCLPLTDCCYCPTFKYYITASIDTAMKLWSEQGTMLHTFTSHSKAVTSVLMHPQSDIIMISASLDKSLRLWNLETWEQIYKLQVCEHGIQWVGLTRDNYLYCGTARDITVWSISFVAHFFSQTRVPVSGICPVMRYNTHKTPRVVAVGEDSSVRLISAATGQAVCTILPPPDISPLNKILDVGYSRYYGLFFLLIDSLNIWVYTSRTNPSSRVDHWDEDILKLMLLATEDVTGTLGVSGSIQCLTVLHNHITVDGDEGPVTPTSVNLLVLALQDGRLVFVDPVVQGLKYHAIAVHRDPIYALKEYEDKFLVTTLSHVTTITFLSLPYLIIMGKVCVGAAGSVFTLLEATIVSSVNNTVLQAQTLLFNTNGCIESKLIAEKRQDSHTPYNVHTLDGCPEQDIVLTCGSDGTLRIWTSMLIPTREIVLNSTLTTACFLNKAGDLLLGFLGNIYKIAAKYTNDGEHTRKSSVTSYLTDSTVFEDPAIKYENMGDLPPTTIDNYLMPYKGRYNTDWQGLCVTDLEEPELSLKKSGESDKGDSLAPTDIIRSPIDTPTNRSVINVSLTSLSESVYNTHYDIGLVNEVQDAWQMPQCGTSPRSSPPVTQVTAPLDVHCLLPPDVHRKSAVDRPRRKSYHLPIQRNCNLKRPDRTAPFESALSDLSLTSISDEEKESKTEKGEKRKNVPLWKPNGPGSQDLQKVIKKKKLEKKKSSKKRMMMRRLHSEGKFSDKFSDVTRTTTDDSCTSLHSEDAVLLANNRDLVDGAGDDSKMVVPVNSLDTHPDKEVANTTAAIETLVTTEDRGESPQRAKYLEKSILAPVTEGFTENLNIEKAEWDMNVKQKEVKKTKSKKKLKVSDKVSVSVSPTIRHPSLPAKPSSAPKLSVLQRDNARALVSPGAPRPRSAFADTLRKGTTVSMVTERLTQSKSLISSKRMDKRFQDGKRVQSAPEVRHPTPPSLQRSKQSCPLTFAELMKAEEISSESKWVLQCLEADVFRSRKAKRVASAPPRFHHPPGTLRPPYMDKPPNPAVEPAYNDTWHEKIVERHETRRRVAEERHMQAAERRRVLSAQKLQKATILRDKCSRMSKNKGHMLDKWDDSPPPGPLPTAISLHSSLNYRVKSAMSISNPAHPPSSPNSTISIQEEAEETEGSPLRAKAAALRNSSEQFLCATSVG